MKKSQSRDSAEFDGIWSKVVNDVKVSGSYPVMTELSDLCSNYPTLSRRLTYYILRRHRYLQLLTGGDADSLEEAQGSVHRIWTDYDTHAEALERKPLSSPIAPFGKHVPSWKVGLAEKRSLDRIGVRLDATRLPIRDNSIDLIVTDPPYGYGGSVSEADEKHLVDAYRVFFREFLRVLKDGGRLVLAVLDKIRTGKVINPQLTTGKLIYRLWDTARLMDIELEPVLQWKAMPVSHWEDKTRINVFHWRGSSVLNRAIVAVRVCKKDHSAVVGDSLERLFACPDCRGLLRDPHNGVRRCESCDREFTRASGLLDLRPLAAAADV